MRTVFLSAIAALLIAPAAADAAPFAIGQGFKPSVAVDANGTAYIAWYGPEPLNSSLQFCRLPRGATSCDVRQAITAPGTSLYRPFVQVSGATVRVAQYRYGITPARTFVFTSADRGVTFDGGREAGSIAFDEAVADAEGTLTVATNNDSAGGLAQSFPLAQGGPVVAFATLFPSDRGGAGTVGYTPDGRLVAAFVQSPGFAAYRVHSGTGDPNDEQSWAPAVDLGYGDYPKLAGDGQRLFLLANDQAGGMYVRRWNGAGFDAAVAVTPGDASESHLHIDGGGRLHAVYPRLDAQGYHLQHSVSDDGATWRSGSVLVQPFDQESALRLAAAPDHVGVAVWTTSVVGAPTVHVTAIGPDAPVAAPTQPPPVQPPPPPADPAPRFNQTVVVRPVRGIVRVRLRGSNRFVNLTSIDDIPFGATIDTRRGEVELRSVASRTGAVQTVRLQDGWFRVSFSRGITNFTLNEPLARCSKRGSAAQRKRKSRKLWGNGTGKFRTTGSYSAATIRGTRWLVQDTCAGTRTRVRQGRVSVRDRVRKRTVVIRGPRGTYLARPRR